MKSIEILLTILENPFAKKHYKDYQNYLISIGKVEDSKIIQHLINKRFPENESNNSNIDQE